MIRINNDIRGRAAVTIWQGACRHQQYMYVNIQIHKANTGIDSYHSNSLLPVFNVLYEVTRHVDMGNVDIAGLDRQEPRRQAPNLNRTVLKAATDKRLIRRNRH